MKIKIKHTLLIKLLETLWFTGKGTYVQKIKRLLKPDRIFSITYQKHNFIVKTHNLFVEKP